MANILITGGTGFVGYWMVKTQPDDANVFALDKWSYNNLNWADLAWDMVVHLAPVSPTRVIRYCLEHESRLLYASSGAVYERTTEYADLKRVYEAECINSGVDVVIARLFTFCGEHLDGDKAFSRFKAAASKGEPIHIWGDGTALRSYMNGEEMGQWLWAILLRGKTREAYDVGSDEAVSMYELASKINEMYQYKSTIIIDGGPEECPVYLPKDTEKTRRLLRG